MFFLGNRLRLALAMAMQGKVDECVTFWDMCCCSWVQMKSGTSKREVPPICFGANDKPYSLPGSCCCDQPDIE